jgi:hypothetical protein
MLIVKFAPVICIWEMKAEHHVGSASTGPEGVTHGTGGKH